MIAITESIITNELGFITLTALKPSCALAESLQYLTTRRESTTSTFDTSE